MSASLPAFSAAPETAEPIAKPRPSKEEARKQGRIRAEEKRRRLAAEAQAEAEAAAAAARGPVARTGRENDVEDGAGSYKLVPIGDLQEDPDQPRQTVRNVAQLTDSLKANGMLQPIVARIHPNGKLTIKLGVRRHRAATMLGWDRVPVIIRYGDEEKDILGHQLEENANREAVEPIEEARAIKRYMDQNGLATHAQAAEKFGHSQTWVSARLALLDLDGATQQQVSKGELSLTDAVRMSRRQSGNTRATGRRKDVAYQHFNDDHELARRAKARCKSNHSAKMPGGVACGPCWEAIIRIDALSGR